MSLQDRAEATLRAALGGWDPANTVMAKGPYYHGTNVALSPGDEIHSANFMGGGIFDASYEHYDSTLVYLTNQDFLAARYAKGAVRKAGGEPHVYEVRPIGVLMPDPEYEASGFGSDQVVANMAEVIREIPIASIQGRIGKAHTAAQISNQTPEQISTGWAFGGKITATEAGQKVGVLEYSIMPGGKVHLDWIHVDPAARHSGIAMQMLEAAQAVVPDKPLSFGLTTADGLKLRWAWEEQHGSTVGAKAAADVSDEPRDESGRWTREAIDSRLEEQLGKPEKLAADKVKHPRSGFDVEVGEDKHVHHPKEWGGPAVLDVDDYGPMPGTPEQDEWRREHKVFNYRKNVRQDPIKDLYRAMSVDEWKWVQEHGYISSDKRGVIDDKEGTNAGIDRETAWSYLPRGQYGDTGVIARIRFDPADGWFTIPHDDYLRTGQHIPIDRIMAVTTPITHGGKYGTDVVKWEDPPEQAKTATWTMNDVENQSLDQLKARFGEQSAPPQGSSWMTPAGTFIPVPSHGVFGVGDFMASSGCVRVRLDETISTTGVTVEFWGQLTPTQSMRLADLADGRRTFAIKGEHGSQMLVAPKPAEVSRFLRSAKIASPWYHGTDRDFAEGDLVEPQGTSDRKWQAAYRDALQRGWSLERAKGFADMVAESDSHTWFTPNQDQAGLYGRNVYEVTPTGPYDAEPEGIEGEYRSKDPTRVVRRAKTATRTYYHGSAAVLHPGDIMYHASPVANRESIARHGLQISYSQDELRPALYFSPRPARSDYEDVWEVDLSGLDIEGDDPAQMHEFGDVGGSYTVTADIPPSRLKLVRPAKTASPFARASAWRAVAARWTFDVDYSESKDTLKAGEVVSGTRRITVDAPDETEARLAAEQQVASMGLVPNRWGWSHNGNEPTGVRLVDVEGWEE